MKSQPRIWSFNLHCGDCLAGKYQVVTLLGAGWEGEVYLVRERGTGIERTVAWVCDLGHLREAIGFPRTLGNMRP